MSQEEPSCGPPTTPPADSAVLRWVGRFVRILLVLAFLAAGAGAGHYWLTHRPKAKRRPPQRQARLVEASAVPRKTESVVIRALGTVVPAKQVDLACRVAGQIVSVEPQFVPGGRFAQGAKVLQIDPKDYELAVQQRTSDLTRAQSDLKLEMGQQSVAQREYQLLGREVREADKDLLLRRPQLARAQAAVAAAQSVLDKAQLDEKRTKVTAPFNAVLQSRHVDLGAQVAIGTKLASLVGTDEYWVQVSVPLDQLKWIDIPEVNSQTGSAVRVYHEAAWGPAAFRKGTVQRLMTELEPQGRMARLLVTVQDPLELKSAPTVRHPLILGSYVRVEITGQPLPDVVRVPRTALRDGGHIWVMRADGTLDIRKVTIAWSGNDHVCIREGLAEGERLITSDLPAPVAGMALRLPGSPPSAGQPPRLAEKPRARGGAEAKQ